MQIRPHRLKLKQLLRAAASEEVIDSISSIADEESVVMLGRPARSGADLGEAALAALEAIEHPRGAAILAALRPRP